MLISKNLHKKSIENNGTADMKNDDDYNIIIVLRRTTKAVPSIAGDKSGKETI